MHRMNHRFLAVLVTLVILAGLPAFARDWQKDPPWVEVPSAPTVAAIGDIHGAFDQFAGSLEAVGMAKRNDPKGYDVTWTGGKGLLIFTGDYGDRGHASKQVYDAVMSLEKQAAAAGGRVIPLLGNHEVMLLNGQIETWANTLKSEKKRHYEATLMSLAGVSPAEITAGAKYTPEIVKKFKPTIAKDGTYGAWIRRRPLFAIVNGYLFIHAGCSKPAKSRSDIAADYRDLVDADTWSRGVVDDKNGVLWLRDWWKDNTLIEDNLERFGVRGIIFGHTPHDPLTTGKKGQITAQGDRLVALDIGMTPVFNESQGGGLLITTSPDGNLLFTAKYPDKPEQLLFTVPGTARPLTPANETPRRTGTAN